MRIRPEEQKNTEQKAPAAEEQEVETEEPEKVAYVEREINLPLINNKLNYNNALLEKICIKLGISLKE